MTPAATLPVLDAAFRHAPLPLAVVDHRGTVIAANRAFQIHPELGTRVDDLPPCTSRNDFAGPDGTPLSVLAWGPPRPGPPDAAPLHRYPTTGLPTVDSVPHILSGFRARNGRIGAVLIQLDRFRHVTRRLPADAREPLLRGVVSRLIALNRARGTLVQSGPDEFLLLFPGAERPEPIAELADEICADVARPVLAAGEPAVLTASVAFVHLLSPPGAQTLLGSLRTAAAAARSQGGNRTVSADPRDLTEAIGNATLTADLIHAVDRDQLHLVYQPIFTMDGSRVLFLEALARWQHPTLGSIPPGTFVPLAERTGTIAPLGAWVLGRAARDLARWRGIHPELRVAVNASAGELGDPDYSGRLRHALSAASLDPEALIVEVAESVLGPGTSPGEVQDPTAADADTAASVSLRELAGMGVGIALSSFGTGRSSLHTLRTQPIAMLKIARTLAASMVDHPEDRAVVAAVVELGASLGIDVVAEGVENEVQETLLRQMNCPAAQGYLLGTPITSEGVDTLLMEAPFHRPGAPGDALPHQPPVLRP